MRTLMLLIVLVLPTFLLAQKITLREGSLDELKGQKEISIQYTYDAVRIGTDTDEKAFVDRKKTEWNAIEPGKGEAFEKYWYDSRKMYYESVFAFQFGKTSGLTVAKSPAPYTLILKTKWIEPGWNAGVVNKRPTIDGQAWIVSSNDPSKVVAVIAFEKCSGDDAKGGDFEMARRIQGAYYTAAIELAKFLKKKL